MKYSVVHRVLLGVVPALMGLGRAANADPASANSAVAPVATESAEARAAVAALGSNDPAQRDAAIRRIIELGADARRAVYEASRGEDPELRARAAELLLKLPWYLPDDSPNVRSLLIAYGQMDVEKRKEVVFQLAELSGHGFEALQRLLVEEPSDDVKWAIVSTVRRNFNDATLQGFRKIELDPESAPLLAAAGHAWLPNDVEKGAKLLRQALTVDLDCPANDGGEVEVAFDRLQNLALLNGHYDELGQLLRLRARRGATDEEGEPSKALLNLFGAHGKFGPLAGFDKDLQTYQAQLGDPRILFALGKVYERTGRRALAAATYRSAFLMDTVSIPQRFEAGDFLIRQGWLDLAEAEFAGVFDLSADHSGERRQMTPELDEANAHFRLAQVAAAREDDFTAAEHMRQGMELHKKARGMLRGATEQGIWQEINWHYLRAAHKKGNVIEVQHRLDELGGTVPTNPDIANDMVPMLRETGREAEAKAFFDKVYQSMQDSADARSQHPMPKNNIAWLCARCGERKEEALRLAEEATRAMPDNAAFVDTLAEAHFQLGHFEEAAKLEARVVRARPNDRFLQIQLKRFQEAAAKNAGH